jgi:hypothetical protein
LAVTGTRSASTMRNKTIPKARETLHASSSERYARCSIRSSILTSSARSPIVGTRPRPRRRWPRRRQLRQLQSRGCPWCLTRCSPAVRRAGR